MVKRAAIYVRISQDREGKSAGVKRQEADCRAWAEKHGVTVEQVFADNDISAYSGKRRPGYEAMCLSVEAGEVDGIIAYHLDRLLRSPLELEYFIALVEQANVAVVTTSGGDYDLGTSDGRTMARVVGAFATKESDDKSRRLKAQRRQMAAEGRRGWGGTRPFGLDPTTRQLVPDEAAIVREAADRALAGETLRSIVIDLDHRDIPTVTGARWTPTVLRTILTSGRISGQVEHLGQLVAPGDWPSIITPAETESLRRRLLDPERRTNGGPGSRPPRRYLLTGLARCGLCGASLVARPTAEGMRKMVCASGPSFHGCGGVAVLAEPLEELVSEAVLQSLDGPWLEAAMRSRAGARAEADMDAEQRELDQAKRQREELAGVYGRGEITLSEWQAARQPLEARIDRAERNLAESAGLSAVVQLVSVNGDLRRRWTTLPLGRRRAVIEALIATVTVGPAVRGRNRFDPHRITIEWRA